MVILRAGEAAAKPLRPVVEVEEDVYSYQPADNGAGPMWCHGNTSIVRVGDQVLASGIETLPGYQPLNNVRWMLFRRGAAGWEMPRNGEDTHEREPCPLVAFPDGSVFLSTNPNTCRPEESDGPATPQLLQFRAADPDAPPETLLPRWDREIAFHAHTYRSFAADGPRQEMLLFYNTAYDRAYWSFRDEKGQWAAQGALEFPWGAEYDTPQPARICYPNVALKDRAAYFCGVSDIVEPYNAWRQYKEEITGRKWDFDFRRLFLTWSDDITTGAFHEWVEVASRDKTCGWIMPNDLHVADDGGVHLVWSERALDERLRERFFPGEKQSVALNYAVVRQGEVVLRRPIQEWNEGEASGERAGEGRFQATPDGRLFVLYFVGGKDAAGEPLAENSVVEVLADGTLGTPVKVPLARALPSYFTATPRAGCAPSPVADVLGDVGGTMRYARIRLY